MARDREAAPKTLVELLERAATRFPDRTFGLRRDDGTSWYWTYRELEWRSRVAAWRLKALGLDRGVRILTWSPSTPALVADYFGAMRAGLVYVPLDLQMTGATIERIVARCTPVHLILGTGRGAPDPADAGLETFPTTLAEDLVADPDESFPADWEAQLARWPRPAPDDIFQLVYTSGTTGTPKGVMLSHGGICSTIDGIHTVIPATHHRVTSMLPLSHLYEQAVGTFYLLDVGADVLQVRSRAPRVLVEAIREHRTTSMITVPQLLDVFWSGLEREVDKSGRRRSFDRLRWIARRLPFRARRWLFRSVHRQFLGTDFRLFVSIGAFLPPSLQLAWETLGITVLQGYGSTETAFGTANTEHDRGPGTVGRTVPPFELRIAADGEVLFRGPSLFKGYWNDPEATAAVFDADGWYHTGDAGRIDEKGRLVLMGRTRDMIVLPNGFNVFPEDIENALRVAGIRESVVVETAPGRIEAVVLAPAGPGTASASLARSLSSAFSSDDGDLEAATRRIDGAVRAANATLPVHARVAAWRFWPDEDFPRTHTFKVKRGDVRRWATSPQSQAVAEDEVPKHRRRTPIHRR